MQEKQKEKLRSGVETALFDGTHRSDEDYRQQFIYNDYHKGMKVLDALERELSHCEEFAFSVAFVTMSGLITLLPMLEELEEKGVKGKILTTNYLNFSDPRALDKLHSFQNIELKMYWADSSIGFHTKGYMFRRGDVYRIIVGSSNLTANALTKNEEWNTKVVSLVQGEYTYNLLTRFQQIWNDERTRSYDDFIEAYREVYQQEKAKRSYSQHYQPLHSEVLTPEATEGELVAEAGDSFYAAGAKGNVVVLRPNLMQQEFINIMTGNFLTGSGKNSFQHAIFLQKAGGDYDIAQAYQTMLQNEEFRHQMEELIAFGLQRYQRYYSNPYEDSGFSLYQKYEYEDVCRILNWQQNIVAQNMGGYKYDATTNTNPVFINYVKAKDIQESINYQDHFLDRQRLISMSKVKRTLHSKEVQRFVNAKENHMPIDLFMRKNKDDKDGAKSFYYLGRMTNDGAKQEKMAGTGDDVVELTWNLDVPVREDIYDYLTSNEA